MSFCFSSLRRIVEGASQTMRVIPNIVKISSSAAESFKGIGFLLNTSFPPGAG